MGDAATWALAILGLLGLVGGIAAWLLSPIWRKIDDHDRRLTFLETGLAGMQADLKWIKDYLEHGPDERLKRH